MAQNGMSSSGKGSSWRLPGDATALAGGEESYARFLSWFTGPLAPIGYLFGIGLSFALFQHIGNGVRHFFMDVGANFELKGNRQSAIATITSVPSVRLAPSSISGPRGRGRGLRAYASR